MSKARFEVIFAPDAMKEYQNLDSSVIEIVDKAIDRLEERADEVGTVLKNFSKTKLAGCKEIKLRDAGVRIVFKVTEQVVNVLRVVYILTVEKRDKDRVFFIASRRYQEFKEEPAAAIKEGKKRKKHRKDPD